MFLNFQGNPRKPAWRGQGRGRVKFLSSVLIGLSESWGSRADTGRA